jgi:hypothetical protein
MKGDFSRSTFDPHKHYTSVRMQQGRVQLDADWNEQQDILLHLITTQLKDLLGPGGTATTDDKPGFAISLEETGGQPPDEDQVDLPDEDQAGQPEEPKQPVRTLPDFQIGAGRYYVDGILCENDTAILFSEQSGYPNAASRLGEPGDHDQFIVYLDVWERHVTAVQDPAIGEIALGGLDTTTRTQTVWQVKFLPLPGYVDDSDDWRERGGLRSLQAWTEFEQNAAQKGRLRAKWENDKEAFLENHLYRVEIHTVADDQVTFKWSRENGSVVFPIREEYLFTWEDVPGKDNDRLRSYLKEGLALDWAEGAKISKPDDGPTIRIEKDEDWVEIVLDEGDKTATLTTSDEKRRLLKVTEENGKRKLYRITNLSVDSGTIECNLENLERDPYQLRENDWVEIVDDVTVLNGRTLPLCRVEELDRPNGKVILQADKESIKRIITEIGERELQHPLLTRWDQKEPNDSNDEKADDSNWENGVISVEKGTWQTLEHGIEVCFTGQGPNQPGDYWLIPARTQLDEGIEWPQQDGQPQAQAPHGIAHHYAPLALLQFGKGGWSVIPDDAARFATLPQVDARLAQVDVHLDEHVGNLARLSDRITVLEERKVDFQAPLVQYFQIADEIQIGHVVSVISLDTSDEADSELQVRLASSENRRDERLVVGVVKDILKDRESCRVVLYGRAQCKVVGEVKPGDVLVPSVKPGYAHKAGLYLRPGTILGKALSSTTLDAEAREEIDEGKRPDEIDMSKRTGTVDMLVTLG